MKTNKLFTPLLFLFIFCSESMAQVKSTVYKKNINTSVEQWQINDIVFRGKTAGIENPFDTEFGAVYTGPNGEIMKVSQDFMMAITTGQLDFLPL